MRWSLRAILGSMQLPVAGLGLVVLGATWWWFRNLPPSPPGSDGFVEGLAGIFLLVFGLAGYALFVAGLLIPPGPGYGIQFTRKQRWLFAYALVVPVVGVVVFFSSIAMSAAVGGASEPLLTVFFVIVPTAPLAVVVGLGWKGGQVAVERYRNRAAGQ